MNRRNTVSNVGMDATFFFLLFPVCWSLPPVSRLSLVLFRSLVRGKEQGC